MLTITPYKKKNNNSKILNLIQTISKNKKNVKFFSTKAITYNRY